MNQRLTRRRLTRRRMKRRKLARRRYAYVVLVMVGSPVEEERGQNTHQSESDFALPPPFLAPQIPFPSP
jgi:hypothetical protein